MENQFRSLLMSLGLLIHRLLFGGLLLFAHGWDKVFNYAEKAETFGDPLGLGPGISLALAAFAEFFCSLFVILGLGTRLVVWPIIFTMATAALIAHAEDPFSVKEKALLFLSAFFVLFWTGAGRFSIDALIVHRRRRKKV